jgi:hypothetical protein
MKLELKLDKVDFFSADEEMHFTSAYISTHVM